MCALNQQQLGRGLAAQGDFRSVDPKDARVAAWRALSAGYLRSRQKPEFHKASSDIGWKVDAIENSVFALFEFSKGRGRPRGPKLLETQLHCILSMKCLRGAVNTSKD